MIGAYTAEGERSIGDESTSNDETENRLRRHERMVTVTVDTLLWRATKFIRGANRTVRQQEKTHLQPNLNPAKLECSVEDTNSR